MNPAFSLIWFTTLAGASQGLVVVLAVATLLRVPLHPGFVAGSLATAFVLTLAALVASFFHLGRPMRAWRAALMWRTSWMSREVIVLPVFMALVGLWWGAVALGVQAPWATRWLPVAALVMAFALWYCTAMIYACIRFIQEWAHPLTVVNYTLIGLSSGAVLAAVLAALAGERSFAADVGAWAIGATLLAWATRAVSLRRNARLKPKSTLQSATGIAAARIEQQSMGLTGGSFNTREFFHRASMQAVRRARIGFQVLGFGMPVVLLALALVTGSTLAWLAVLPLQFVGLLAERWFFFAQARHPQNLYYQVVS